MRKISLYGFTLLAALAAGLAFIMVDTRPAPAHLSLEAPQRRIAGA